MTLSATRFDFGQEVLVFDGKGNYECRGKIVGRYASNPHLYDVQVDKVLSIAGRLCGIPENRLRPASGVVRRMVQAYAGKALPDLKHILDQA